MRKQLITSKNFGQPFGFALLIIPFLLDVIEISMRGNNSDVLGHIACSILPFAKFSVLFMAPQLGDFVIKQCILSQFGEPTISIIFFMLKIIIALAMPILWLLLISLSKIIFTFPDTSSDVDLNSLKKSSFTLIGLLLFCVYFMLQYHILPPSFGIGILSKLKEDFACFVIFVAELVLISYIQSVVLYLMRRFNNTNSRTPNL